MGDGFQFIDIIFFAMIAAFLVLRLRSVLGRRDGHEGGHHDPFSSLRSEEQAKNVKSNKDNVVHLPGNNVSGDDDFEAENDEEQNPLAAGFAEIRKTDGQFNPEDFVSGARIAFELVLGSYAAGDTKALKPLLSAEVFGNFVQTIKGREQSGETLEETLVGINKSEIVEAYMEDSIAHITVKFVSEQISVTRDENGEVIDGNPDYISEITDFWTFARDTEIRDPNWVLVATRSLD